MSTTVHLKNTINQGLAAQGSFLTAAFLVNVPSFAKPQSQGTFRHTGTVGFWYVLFNKTSSAPSTSLYDIKLGPGEFFTEDQLPIGDIWILADANVDNNLFWYVGWFQ